MNKPGSESKSPAKSFVQPSLALKIFVLWHVYAITAWSLPAPPNVLRRGDIQPTFSRVISDPVPWFLTFNMAVKDADWLPLKWYMESTGLWQYWDMFAPNPLSLDHWFDSEVTYKDGSRKIQPYPRMASMSLPERYVKERFRKYSERVNPDFADWKKPAVAQWLALQAATDPNNPPIFIEFRRHFRWLPKYGEPIPEEYRTEVMVSLQVDQEKLRRDKGW